MRARFTPLVGLRNSTNSNIYLTNKLDLIYKRKVKSMSTELNQNQEVKEITANASQQHQNGKKRSKLDKAKDQASASLSFASRAVTSIRNVFKNIPQGLADRHKYVVNHVEMDLLPQITNGVIENIHGSTLPYGGDKFMELIHEYVMRACSKDVNWLPNIQTVEDSVYRYLYNSRSLFALLKTAVRCQNTVQSVDRDNLYLAPIFNNHLLRNYQVGWNGSSFCAETDSATVIPTTNRQTYCFSFRASAAEWNNNFVTQASRHMRLSRKWKDFLDYYFGKIHAVAPTDFSTTPTFAVFWPDGTLIPASGAPTARGFAGYLETVDDGIATTQVAYNTTNAQLQAQIDAFAAQQELLEQNAAVSEVLDKLTSDGIIENVVLSEFKRDMSNSAVSVAINYDLSKLLRSSLAPVYQYWIGSATTRAYTRGAGISPYHLPFVISIDPSVQFNKGGKLDTDSHRVLIDYDVQKDGFSMEYAFLTNHIAPMHVELVVLNNANHPYYWAAPYSLAIPYTANTYGNMGSVVNQEDARFQLLRFQIQQGVLIGRGTMANAPDTATMIRNYGIIQSGAYLPYYNLKDYIISDADGAVWVYNYADVLTSK